MLNNRNIWARCLVTLLAAALLAGCSPVVRENAPVERDVQAEDDAGHYPVEIENLSSKGDKETQTYKASPKRVVAVWQNSIETLLALGVGDRIVAGMGVPDEKYILPEYRAKYEKIPYTSLENLDMETIMMMEPDLIVGWYSTFQSKVLRSTQFWHDRGIHTYIAPASSASAPEKTLDEEYQDILNMGKIFDRQERAEAIVGKMKDEISRVTEASRELGLHRRGIIVELTGRNLQVYGEKTLAGHILEAVGGELLGADLDAISKEQLVDMDPDAIFVVVIESDYDRADEILDILYHDSGLQSLSALQNHRIYALPLYSIYSSGIRTYDGIQKIAKGLYPELYSEESK